MDNMIKINKPSPKVLVVGDGMVDKWWIGHTRGPSAEAPIPIVDVFEYPIMMGGGAKHVAAAARELDAKVSEMISLGPVKNRLYNEQGQIARWDYNDFCSPVNLHGLKTQLTNTQFDGIVVSDYGKGSVNIQVVEIIETYRGAAKMYVDTKSPEKFKNAFSPVVFFPNEAEWEKDFAFYSNEPFVVKKTGATGARMKIGADVWTITSTAREVRSVCGAGDLVLAAFAVYHLKTGDPVKAFRLAGIAAGLGVETQYTITPPKEKDILTRYSEVYND